VDLTFVLESLKKHLSLIENTGNNLYITRTRQTIQKLENHAYIYEWELITDLQALGFTDLASQIRRGYL